MSFKWLIIPVLRIGQCILTGNIKFIKSNIMQEHIDSAKVVGGNVDFLTIETLRTVSFPKIFADFSSREPEPQAGSYTLLISVFPTNVKGVRSSETSCRSVKFTTRLFPALDAYIAIKIFISITKCIYGIVFVHHPDSFLQHHSLA